MSGKRHHFIPQFLQRGFANQRHNKDFYTWVYRKGDLNPFNTNIKNVGLEGYFYSEDKESTLDDIITAAETEYAVFIEQLRNHDGVKKIDNKKAANLIAHLEVRTKNLRDSFRYAGTILLTEIANYLQDPRNCEKFVNKQVSLEVDTLINQELEKRNIPKTLFPIYRHQFIPVIKEKIPEMTERMARMMKDVSENIGPLLEKSAKSGQIKALLGNHSPPIKASSYEKLHYNVVSTGDMSVPLGDSAVIFHIEKNGAFKPYHEIDKKLQSVILPISSSQLLVGSTKNYHLNIEDIPEAIASCSLDYFISNQDSSTNEALAKHISKSARMITETEIEDILGDLVNKK